MTFVGASSAGENIKILPIAWPAGVAAGDVAILCWSSSAAQTTTVPSGFVRAGSVTTSAGLRSEVYRRVCTGDEGGSLQLSSSGINRQSATLVVERGVSGAQPIDVFASRSEAAAGTSHASPPVTTVRADVIVYRFYSERSTNGTNNAVPGSGYAERADSGASGWGSGGTITAAAQESPLVSRPAGATISPPAWTSGNGFATANVVTWTVALRPSSATGGAGLDQIDVEPGTPVTLTGTAPTWTQVEGPAVVLTTPPGQPNVRTFEAPATIDGATLRFENSNSGASPDVMAVTVLPVTERIVENGVEVPLLWSVVT